MQNGGFSLSGGLFLLWHCLGSSNSSYLLSANCHLALVRMQAKLPFFQDKKLIQQAHEIPGMPPQDNEVSQYLSLQPMTFAHSGYSYPLPQHYTALDSPWVKLTCLPWAVPRMSLFLLILMGLLKLCRLTLFPSSSWASGQQPWGKRRVTMYISSLILRTSFYDRTSMCHCSCIHLYPNMKSIGSEPIKPRSHPITFLSNVLCSHHTGMSSLCSLECIFTATTRGRHSCYYHCINAESQVDQWTSLLVSSSLENIPSTGCPYEQTFTSHHSED